MSQSFFDQITSNSKSTMLMDQIIKMASWLLNTFNYCSLYCSQFFKKMQADLNAKFYGLLAIFRHFNKTWQYVTEKVIFCAVQIRQIINTYFAEKYTEIPLFQFHWTIFCNYYIKRSKYLAFLLIKLSDLLHQILLHF